MLAVVAGLAWHIDKEYYTPQTTKRAEHGAVKVIAAAIIAMVLALGLAAPVFADTTTSRHETTTSGWSRNKNGDHVLTVVHTNVITKSTTNTVVHTVHPTVYGFPTVCQQAINEYAAAMNGAIDGGLFAIYDSECSDVMFPPVSLALPGIATPALDGTTTARREKTTAGWSVNKHGVRVLTVVHTITVTKSLTNTVVHNVIGSTVHAYPPVCQAAIQQYANPNAPTQPDYFTACQNLMYPPPD